MSRHRYIQFTIAVLVLAFITAPSVTAQPYNRTFVSAQAGNDTNGCTPTAPCRSFGRAMTQTAPGGEVIVLDSGGYGVFVVTQSVQINATAGVYAGVTATAGSAVTINDPALIVRIKGLTIKGAGGATGILASAVGTLYVENTSISGFSLDGIMVSSAGSLLLSDSLLRRNASTGINLITAAGTVKATIQRVSVQENGYGLWAGTNAEVVVHDSFADNNSVAGFQANYGYLTLENCAANHNSAGVVTQLGSVRMSNCTITHNNTGLQNDLGILVSRQNNTVELNSTESNGVIGTYPAK